VGARTAQSVDPYNRVPARTTADRAGLAICVVDQFTPASDERTRTSDPPTLSVPPTASRLSRSAAVTACRTTRSGCAGIDGGCSGGVLTDGTPVALAGVIVGSEVGTGEGVHAEMSTKESAARQDRTPWRVNAAVQPHFLISRDQPPLRHRRARRPGSGIHRPLWCRVPRSAIREFDCRPR